MGVVAWCGVVSCGVRMLYFEITIGPMYIAMTHDCLMGWKTFLQKKYKNGIKRYCSIIRIQV